MFLKREYSRESFFHKVKTFTDLICMHIFLLDLFAKEVWDKSLCTGGQP